jgi:hypothetical protein
MARVAKKKTAVKPAKAEPVEEQKSELPPKGSAAYKALLLRGEIKE